MALNFPAKVYQILENESCDIIRWHENGMAFRILDHGRFEREIIPKYFRHNQISSVQRQLNLYGFKCISRGEDKGAFFHPSFRRGDWETVRKITRYVPTKRVFSLDSANPNDKKNSEEDYVFQNGCYQPVNSLGGQSVEFQPQHNYYAGVDSYTSFRPQVQLAGNSSVRPEWHNYNRNQTPVNERMHPQPPQNQHFYQGFAEQQRPSALTSRLGYKFPSVAQLTSTVAANKLNNSSGQSSSASGQSGKPAGTSSLMREFIIYTSSGTVQIDPDFDLHDCLNTTVDYDIGRHSVNAPPPPSQPMRFAHAESKNTTDSHSLASTSVSVTGKRTRSDSNDSLEDFAELCADLSE